MKIILSAFIIAMTIVTFSCNEEEQEDLTIDIVGTYIGQYSSNLNGVIEEFKIEITKIDAKRISVEPMTDSLFSTWITGLERFNSSTITSTIGQVDPAITFTTGSDIGMRFQRASEGDDFIGVRIN